MPEGYDLRAFDILDSTNVECRRIADAGQGGNVWVVAAAQSAGKGRRGREWVSRPGNLFASLLYAIDCDLATASQLSFVTALAVRDVVADILQSPDIVRCKWPNDVLARGKKIAGILLETAGQGSAAPSHVIIGVGINVAHHPENGQYPATSLTSELGREIDAPLVLERLIHSMDFWVARWKNQGFSVIRQAWKDSAHGLRQEVIVRLQDEEIKGIFVDLDETGALILEFEGKRRHITAGDVFFP
ncbi:Biotin--protein ligase [hydrothermal vent metagenome]|uniref:Biotin--protein ligase n=1 Tax=hydrothermal vent metagenome TaxID=652676 RepID=A0A3B1BU32_9ZZZZ